MSFEEKAFLYASRHTSTECAINPSFMVVDFSLTSPANPESHLLEDKTYADFSDKLDRHTLWLNLR